MSLSKNFHDRTLKVHLLLSIIEVSSQILRRPIQSSSDNTTQINNDIHMIVE